MQQADGFSYVVLDGAFYRKLCCKWYRHTVFPLYALCSVASVLLDRQMFCRTSSIGEAFHLCVVDCVCLDNNVY